MDCIIRPIKEREYPLLASFLYEAIFIPEGAQAPPQSIINTPAMQVYLSGFGTQKHDKALVAEMNGTVVGAVWVRIMRDYGHINDKTPSFAISVYQAYRRLGIGTELMKKMLSILKRDGYKQASLAVQKANYAVGIYQKIGFVIVAENDEEYIMAKEL